MSDSASGPHGSASTGNTGSHDASSHTMSDSASGPHGSASTGNTGSHDASSHTMSDSASGPHGSASTFFGSMDHTEPADVSVPMDDAFQALLTADKHVEALMQLRKSVLNGCENCLPQNAFVIDRCTNTATGAEYTFDAEQNAEAAQVESDVTRRGSHALSTETWVARVNVIGDNEGNAKERRHNLMGADTPPAPSSSGPSVLAIGLIAGGAVLIAGLLVGMYVWKKPSDTLTLDGLLCDLEEDEAAHENDLF
eukprot:TRINITY_DN25_c0_g1_i4.p2 TRINITY_DN25_c0_g1~~TRINITY_DN25_c0_g1_i4.p2  ORF type:complete len:253 (+),score=49.02 TRINITY_DN25_c0_g1_i4:276-1034(+)